MNPFFTVEELECLATWKESSNHYLVGRLHHRMATTDEQRYRCFIYQKSDPHTYQLGQSGEATCNGLLSLNDGSRTIKLKRSEYLTVYVSYLDLFLDI